MGKSRVLSLIMITVIFLTVTIATIIKVYNNHRDKLVLVVEKRLEEAARSCIIDGKCTEEDHITLGTLINHEYLESQIHPLSKEYISEETAITCKNYICETNID